MFLGSNIKFLRNKKGLRQSDLAEEFEVARTTINNYENGIVLNLTSDLLIRFSKYFNVSIDLLLKKDLTVFSDRQLDELQNGFDAYTTGTKLRILASTVDKNNHENVELVNIRARAGYANGYGDIEYIKKLPTFQLPFLSRDKKYRAFQVSGDSMHPIQDKSYVIGEFVHDMHNIIDGQAYIVITLDDGIVFKLLKNDIKHSKNIVLSSLNPYYDAYEMKVNKVKEVWKFTHCISSQLPEPVMSNESLVTTVLKLKKDVSKLLQ